MNRNHLIPCLVLALLVVATSANTAVRHEVVAPMPGGHFVGKSASSVRFQSLGQLIGSTADTNPPEITHIRYVNPDGSFLDYAQWAGANLEQLKASIARLESLRDSPDQALAPRNKFSRDIFRETNCAEIVKTAQMLQIACLFLQQPLTKLREAASNNFYTSLLGLNSALDIFIKGFNNFMASFLLMCSDCDRLTANYAVMAAFFTSLNLILEVLSVFPFSLLPMSMEELGMECLFKLIEIIESLASLLSHTGSLTQAV